MKIIYYKTDDVAFIYLTDDLDVLVESTYPCDLDDAMINLDFDKSERLVRIEVHDASKKLSEELLKDAILKY